MMMTTTILHEMTDDESEVGIRNINNRTHRVYNCEFVSRLRHATKDNNRLVCTHTGISSALFLVVVLLIGLMTCDRNEDKLH